jgi:uncharacterized protein YicC (UPF0701 family)
MNIRIFSFALILMLSGLFYSCAENSPADNEMDEIEAETENAISDMGAEIREEGQELDREFREARTNVSNRMSELERDMETASAEARAEMQEEYDELRTYRDDIDARMDRVGNNMEAGWRDFKGDVRQGWADFRTESNELLRDVERTFDPEGDLD